MYHITNLSNLNKEWQDWVAECYQKGVALAEVQRILKDNNFIAEIAPSASIPQISLENNDITIDGKSYPLLFVNKNPLVAVIGNFLTPEECQGLIDYADNKFVKAQVIDDATGGFVEVPNRTSMNASFRRGEIPLIADIENRISKVIHWEVEKGEPIQVLRYQNGGEYKPHYDWFDPNSVGGQKNINQAGQRVGTFLMYLSDVEAGGATAFPKLGFEVRPKAGMALYFADVVPDGTIDPQTLHSSIPVVQGTKYLATKWLRERPYPQ